MELDLFQQEPLQNKKPQNKSVRKSVNLEVKEKPKERKNEVKFTDNIKPKEICFCRFTYEETFKKTKHKRYVKLVYKRPEGESYFSSYFENRFKKETGVGTETITNIEIIARLGFENSNKGFTEVKRSQEERNKITGQYD